MFLDFRQEVCYRKHMGETICTPHMIREVVLDELVPEDTTRTLY